MFAAYCLEITLTLQLVIESQFLVMWGFLTLLIVSKTAREILPIWLMVHPYVIEPSYSIG